MEATLQKKCAFCGEYIIVDSNHIDIISFKNKNYHCDCFTSMCNERVLKHNRYSLIYSDALEHYTELKNQTKTKIIAQLTQDEFNRYLICNYNVGAFSSSFWNIISDIQKGIYRHKACTPIDLSLLLDMWKESQSYLDKTNAWNESHGKCIDGEQRVKYDLAILMPNYGKYKRKKEKADAQSRNALNTIKQAKETVNYSALTKTEKNDSVDISSMVDNIF